MSTQTEFDKELDAVVSKLIHYDWLNESALDYDKTYAEAKQVIATLIREARVDELKDLQIKGKGNKFTPFEYHYYINNRITELTNQQKGEQ